MWSVLCLIAVALVGSSYQRAPVRNYLNINNTIIFYDILTIGRTFFDSNLSRRVWMYFWNFIFSKVLPPTIHQPTGGPGELSPSAFVDYVNWWQNIIGIIHNSEEPAAEPSVTPINQSECAPCSKYLPTYLSHVPRCTGVS